MKKLISLMLCITVLLGMLASPALANGVASGALFGSAPANKPDSSSDPLPTPACTPSPAPASLSENPYPADSLLADMDLDELYAIASAAAPVESFMLRESITWDSTAEEIVALSEVPLRKGTYSKNAYGYTSDGPTAAVSRYDAHVGYSFYNNRLSCVVYGLPQLYAEDMIYLLKALISKYGMPCTQSDTDYILHLTEVIDGDGLARMCNVVTWQLPDDTLIALFTPDEYESDYDTQIVGILYINNALFTRVESDSDSNYNISGL